MEDLTEAGLPFCGTVNLDERSSFSGGGFTKIQNGLNSAVLNNSITCKTNFPTIMQRTG